jgi:hypothetical protein
MRCIVISVRSGLWTLSPSLMSCNLLTSGWSEPPCWYIGGWRVPQALRWGECHLHALELAVNERRMQSRCAYDDTLSFAGHFVPAPSTQK